MVLALKCNQNVNGFLTEYTVNILAIITIFAGKSHYLTGNNCHRDNQTAVITVFLFIVVKSNHLK